MINIQEIKKKLDLLKQLDSDFTIFGSTTHQYKMNPVISMAKLENFEKKYEIKLPADYRKFLTEIGNGGAGPYFGILPLPMNVDPFDIEYNLKGLKQSFKYDKPWNWSEKVFEKFYVLFEEKDEEIEDFFQHLFSENYYHEKHIEGSLYIADYGCALRYYLVVSGKEKGNIWFDQRADHDGITPVLNHKKKPITFTDWYINWLDVSLNNFK